jgi:nitrate/nitrite-specific signal transduction histidine kinase
MAVDDLLRLSEASRRLTGLLDAATLARRAAREFGRIVGTDATGVSIREAPDLLVTRGAWRVRTEEVRDGLRIAVGDGVGGKVLATGEPLSVDDFAAAPAISERLIEQIVRHEGVHGMLGVPIGYRGGVIGVLYAMNRTPGHVGERARTLALEFAATLGPTLGAAMRCASAARRSALEERRRISGNLLGNLSPWVLDITRAVQQASLSADPGAEEILADLRIIEAQAEQVAAWLRDIHSGLEQAPAEEALPAAIGVDVGGVSSLTDLAADFAVIGRPYDLTVQQESVLLAVVREGLAHVAGQARVSTVLVTLGYGLDGVDVLVQDDGGGLPRDLEEGAGASRGRFGFAALGGMLAQLGGELVLEPNDDGGMTLRGRVPAGRR